MKHSKTIFFSLLVALLFSSAAPEHEDWGFFGHQRINRMAVFTLPPDMIVFYKKNIEYITKHAIDPDKRRYIAPQEAPRHYIDLDHYGKIPFDNVPRRWNNALAKFTDLYVVTTNNDTLHLFGNDQMRYTKDSITINGDAVKRVFQKDSIKISTDRYVDFVKKNIANQFYELDWFISQDSLDTLFQTNYFAPNCNVAFAKDYLSNYGIVPWHLEKMLYRLTLAFKEVDEAKILKYSAEIGHYIGDAHVPLHTTENYNGQLTNQVGIHGFWESRLPELFADNYNYFVGKSQYIDRTNPYFWGIVLNSHALLDSVLLIEKDLTNTMPSDLKYCYETRGTQTIRTYCQEFSNAYHKRLEGMVEKQMCNAILSIGSVWRTAWVNAGQPDLRKLSSEMTDLEEEQINLEERKIKGRQHEN